jgi:hypothetical protein
MSPPAPHPDCLAPRNRDPREAETGPLVDFCQESARAAAADINDRPVTMYAIGPVGMQNSRIWVASVLNRKRADSRAERTPLCFKVKGKR